MVNVCAVNETKGICLARHVTVATSLWARCVGLLGRPSLPAEEGLWLKPCRSIHTFFMRFPIDVIFLDEKGMILFQKTMSPWAISPWIPKSIGVLELAAGTLKRTGTEAGDQIKLSGGS